MKLSNGEKLILLMLCEIYQKLGIKGETDPKFVQSAILSGNEWGFEWKYSGIPFEREKDPAIVSEVADLLDMWSFIEEAYAEMSKEEKEQIEKGAGLFGRQVKFRGFDGNNETEHINVARFLIDDLDRFSIFKGRDLNSHMPSIDTYRRMYAVFKPMRDGMSMGQIGLSVAQIIEILKAMDYRKE